MAIDKPEDVVKFIWQWLRENETELERLAAETGKAQERTIGIEVDPQKTVLLEVDITCEPRQFAKRVVRGKWAKLFKPGEQK